MRKLLITVLAVAVITPAFAEKTADSGKAAKPRTIRVPNGPTINQLPGFPVAQLRFNLAPKLYKAISISPVMAWVIAQTGPAMPQPKIARSDAGGKFDHLAIALAKEWSMQNYDTTNSRTHNPTLNVHLLVFQIADGIMAVNFSHNDEAYYAGFQHTDVWVGVWKDGKWTTVGGTKRTRELTQPYY
ncbi:MAG: hypothetical protein ACJ8I9_09405 [Chthoniobacterales bacterium]